MPNIKEKLFLPFIRGKVIAAFLIGAIAIGLSWVVTRVGFQEMLFTVTKLATPNEKLQVVNNLFHEITRLDQLQRAHAIKSPDKPYPAFKKQSAYLVRTLDTLRNLSAGNSLQIRRLDSMAAILRSRDKLLQSYLGLRADLKHNEMLSKRIQAVSTYITKHNKPQADTSIIITNQRYITTTTVPSAEPAKPATRPKSSFFGRLFGSRKPAGLPPALKQVEEELQIQVDTLAVARQDSSIWKVQKMMRRIEREQHQRTTKLLNRELDLVNTSNQLHHQLLAILHLIEAEELKLVKHNSQLATEVVQASINRMNAIVVIFFLVAAILVYLIFIDISRSHQYRKQLVAAKEEAEHLGQVKQRFLANMSHEIRTPLQAIIGFAEQVRQQQQPRKEDLDAIYRSAEHLLQIVNEVLDYSRITSGRFTFEQQPFDMPQLISEVVATMRLSAGQKSLALLLESNLPEGMLVTGDPFRLRQVLYNLLGNAIKFTEAGEVCLSVQYVFENDQFIVVFEVTDTGIGIPASELERIFYLFEQADASVARTHGGTGLGLSIVQTLVNCQGGSIGVSSEPGKGSSFVVKLPFARVAAPTSNTVLPVVAATSPQNPLPAQTNGKVLVVDDDAFILQLCATILAKHGIMHCCTAQAASLLTQQWDATVKLVLMDIRMPEINGLALCRALRQKVPTEVKIVALTAQALPEERMAILNQGFDGLLMKPFREQDLMALINEQGIAREVNLTVQSILEAEPDLSLLIKMTGGDDEQLKAILNQFILETQHDLQQLNRCLTEGLPSPAGEAIHRLAGRTGQLGSKELSARLRLVEVALHKQQPLEGMLPEIGSLQKEVKELKQKIRRKISNLEEA